MKAFKLTLFDYYITVFIDLQKYVGVIMIVSKEKLMRFLRKNNLYKYEVMGDTLKISYMSGALSEKMRESAEIVILGKIIDENILIEKAFLVREGISEEIDIEVLGTWLELINSIK